MIDLAAVQEVASLPLAGLAMWFMFKLSSNHVNHNTVALEKLTDALGAAHQTDIEFQGWLKGYFAAQEQEKSNARNETN